jgi:hypothetical protein
VSVVDLDPLLCPGNPCPVVWNDGTIMYRDTHHVSASMSRELGPALGAKVAHVLSP